MGRWWRELQRRKVPRAALLYVGAVWALAQGIAQLAPEFGAPPASVRWFVLAAAVAFPFWMVLAWRHDLSLQGLRRDEGPEMAAGTAPRRGRRSDLALVAVLSLAVVLLLVNQFRLDERDAAPAPAVASPSVAVLPFQNLSDHADNEYFVAGMQDLILTRLAGINGLRVVSRTSVQGYASRPANLRQVAEELGVSRIIEGSVQRQGRDVLINVQLIDAHDDSHLWAESYRRTLDDIFGVEGEVAGRVAAALQVKLSPAESTTLAHPATRDPMALDFYLQAGFAAQQGHRDYDTARLQEAVRLYREAVAHDPGFALALARLSYVESELAWFGGGGTDSEQLSARARLDAERAARLDPELPEAQLALGYSAYWGRADHAAADRAFAAALALRPGYGDALAARAFVARRQGRFAEAMRFLDQARTGDPRNSTLAFEAGATAMLAGTYDDAKASLERALELDPDNLNARYFLSNAILFASGDAVAALEPLAGDSAYMKLQRSTVLGYLRRYEAAIAEVEAVPDLPENFQPGLNPPKSLQLAELHRLAGHPAAATPLYERALVELRGQQAGQSDVNLAFVWSCTAGAELNLGHVQQALESIARSQEILAASPDRLTIAVPALVNAFTYAQAGRAEAAVSIIAEVLAAPGSGNIYAPVLLWVDPVWDPIRQEPVFIALRGRYADHRPAARR
ncbi:MAG: tetratricopeptide repeat protein [Xanthomonadales bacterium]|nr:tetratricopeptide repeat protein [Xanthomonadales bacterium]